MSLLMFVIGFLTALWPVHAVNKALEKRKYLKAQQKLLRLLDDESNRDLLDRMEIDGVRLTPKSYSSVREKMKSVKIPVLLYKGEDSELVAECPAFEGCITQGADRDEALRNIREAIALCLDAEDETEKAIEFDVFVVDVPDLER